MKYILLFVFIIYTSGSAALDREAMLESANEVLLEGEKYGKGKNDTECVKYIIPETILCRWDCYPAQRAFLKSCLKSSTFTESLCTGVPKKLKDKERPWETTNWDEIFSWSDSMCNDHRAENTKCRYVLLGVVDHCTSALTKRSN